MKYRKEIKSTRVLGRWYDKKYLQMGGCWNTPVEEINKRLDQLGVVTGWLLDIGSGDGSFLVEAQKRVKSTGIEISKIAHNWAIVKGVDSRFMSAERMDFKDGQFDYIVSIGSLEHIVNLDKGLNEIQRVLKKTGKFLFLCPNEGWKHDDQPNERIMTDDEWIKLFKKHFLDVTEYFRENDNTVFIGEKCRSI